MPVEVLLTEYGSPDYEAAVRLREAVLRAPLGLKMETRDVERDHEDVHLVAREGGFVVGCAIVRAMGNETKIRQVAVAESHRGRGVGKMLVRAAEDVARTTSARGIVLHAREAAVEFYRSLGYLTRGEPFVEVGISHVEMHKLI